MATGLKSFTDILIQFRSRILYYKEYIIFYISVSVLISFLAVPEELTILYLLLFSVLTVSFAFLFHRRKRADIKELIGVIRKIRQNELPSHESITLNSGLQDLESEIQLAYRQIQRDINSLRRLERVRTEFLSNVSHELKTPLFAIQGFLETLLNGAIHDPKVNIHFLEKAMFHSNNLASLLNDLVEISLIEAGEMKMSFRYFAVCDYLKTNFSDYADEAARKGIGFRFILPEKDFDVYGDKNRLKQVMHNLIQNAIKYTETGEITVEVSSEQKKARIAVRDTGIGIAEEDLSRVFERFYRVDKARSKEIEGTGLGLAIVKHIIEAHGSVIQVDSVPGQGSEFYFMLKK